MAGNADVKTFAVATGEEGLSLLQQQTFDCVILDLGLLPRPGYFTDTRALGNLALLADSLINSFELFDQALVDCDQLVKLISDQSIHPIHSRWHPHGEISLAQARERICQLTLIEAGR